MTAQVQVSTKGLCGQAWNDAFDVQHNYFTKFQDDNDLMCIFSMFDEGIDFDAKSPCKVGAKIVNECSVWGYRGEGVVGGTGTWGDVYKACNAALLSSINPQGYIDHHHFLEDLEGTKDTDGNFYWSMVMGS